jgi:asparagine synthase (glutamine-hydrolysing)
MPLILDRSILHVQSRASMSGFAGVIRLDGRLVDGTAADTLRAAIAHRGRDGGGTYFDAGVTLVQATLHSTAESTYEALPITDDSGVTIVADVRLDNREVLIRALGLSPSPERPIGDGALLLAAWKRWGEGCPDRLEGDFAFALWDRQERRLFCARDPFGVKPLVYSHLEGQLFAFASEVQALLELPELPRDLDEQRIAAFLAIDFDDTERTFYRALRRLPGGHSLTLHDGRPAISRYWDPGRVRPLRLRSNAEYAEGFLEHFRMAVGARMRVRRPSELGSLLSGGLDSSAITCFARDERARRGEGSLPVFSWIFSDALDADERRYQQIVIAAGGLIPHTLDSATADLSPWSDLELLLAGGPLYAPNFYLNTGIAKAAHNAGITVLLDGLGGDGVISRGAARLPELFLHGRMLTLARELRALGRRSESDWMLPHLFLSHVAAPLAPQGLLRFGAWLRRRAPSSDPGLHLLRPELARRIEASTRFRYRPFLTARQEHLAQLTAPMIAEGLELFDRILAPFGVEGRYPFFDRRLAEYCLSLPADQKLADGYSRIVARRALEGIVPPEVQWRAGKGRPGLHVIRSLRASRQRLDDLFLQDPAVLEPYVDLDVLGSAYLDLIEGRMTDYVGVVRLWSAAVLGSWLRAQTLS